MGTTAHLEKNMDTTKPEHSSGPQKDHPVGAGLGATTGGLAGAMVGGLAAGPLGAVAGATIGGGVGGVIGVDIAQDTARAPVDASSEHYARVEPLLLDRFRDREYAQGRRFEDFYRAYLHGVACHDRHGYQIWTTQIEQDVQQAWEQDPASNAMPWEVARDVIVDGWHAAEHVGAQDRTHA